MRVSSRRAGACLLSAAAALLGCAKPAPAPPAVGLLPVPDHDWQTFQAVLAGKYSDAAASYDGVYVEKKARTRFRIEVRVPRYADSDTTGQPLVERRLGQLPAEVPYVAVRIYVGNAHLAVAPTRISPRGPCGPAGTPPSAVSVGVHTEVDRTRFRKLPGGSPFTLAYSRIFVRFDADPGQLATCSLDFSGAIGNGKLAIPPLRLVSDAFRQYAPTVNEAPDSD